jgi:ATP-dependent Lon protease
MQTIKDLILDYIATMQLQSRRNTNMVNQMPKLGEQQGITQNMVELKGSSANAPVLLFVGLQGVGKTSIAKSIAQSMGREFVRISLGAIGDVRTLRGTPKQVVDAEPGSIIKALVRSQTMNPVILLDEIEKSSGNAGLLNDVMAALLEILDPEQNSAFIDHYIDYPVDLSQVFFICTANNLGGLSAALLDRVEVIRFTSYSDQEKEVIAKQYILPKVLKNLNLTTEEIQIQDTVWSLIIRPVGFDAGIRQLERNIATLARSAARMIVEGAQLPIVITPENLNNFIMPDQGPLS